MRRSGWSCSPGSRGGELSEVLIGPAHSRSAPCTRTCTGPLHVLAFVSLSLPRGVTAGGNHGVRSRYTRTLLFH